MSRWHGVCGVTFSVHCRLHFVEHRRRAAACGGNDISACIFIIMPEYLPVSEIETDRPASFWIKWLEDEKKLVRHRFGNDDEARQYFPDDYYERMEAWWATERRDIDPIAVYRDKGGIIRIEDGSHRFAISHKLKHKTVPIFWTRT